MRNLITRAVLVVTITGFGAYGTDIAFAQNVQEAMQSAAPVQIDPTKPVPTLRFAANFGVTAFDRPFGYLFVDANTIRFEVISPNSDKNDKYVLARSDIARVEWSSDSADRNYLNIFLANDIAEYGEVRELVPTPGDPDITHAKIVPPNELYSALTNFNTAYAAASGQAPGSASARPPATVANTPPPVSSSYGDKRLAIKMVSQCPSDPDVLGLVSDSDYSDCKQDELDRVKGWIDTSLKSKGVFGVIGDDNPNLILTVTITGDMDDSDGNLQFEANYRLADMAGHVLQNGTVADQGSDDQGYPYPEEDVWEAAEQQFADKIAAAVTANSGAGASGVGGTNVASLQAAPPHLRFGIKMMNLAPSDAKGLGHPGMTGVLVVNYEIGSVADKAGIRSGDVIYEFDGKTVADTTSLAAAIAAEPAGKAVTVKLLHSRQDTSVTVQF